MPSHFETPNPNRQTRPARPLCGNGAQVSAAQDIAPDRALVAAGMTSEMHWYLQNWARFMRSGGRPDGLPKLSQGVENYRTYDANSEVAHERNDTLLAIATDGAVMDLVAVEFCAIHHRYLSAVFRFYRVDLDLVLESASSHVQAALERKGLFVPQTVVDNA